MRILHVTTLQALAPGHRRQLRHEVLAAREANLQWDTISLQSDPTQSEFEKQVPKIWRSGIMLRLYRWVYVIRRAREYDFILLRAVSMDLFGPVLGFLVPNRVTVHHAKEIEELEVANKSRMTKWFSIFAEKWLAPLTMRSARGIAAVTSEILDYEVARFPHLENKGMVFPNGYYFGKTQPLVDERQESTLNFTFVCSTFSEWHGLDRLLEAIELDINKIQKPIRVHLVGELSEVQMGDLRALNRERIEIVVHGTLDFNGITSLLAKTDVALGSLALDRKNLFSASTLKVREYLSGGVPVYATHLDSALPESFPFYYADTAVSLTRMIDFAESMAAHSREDVRQAAQHYLDKRLILERALNDLAEM